MSGALGQLALAWEPHFRLEGCEVHPDQYARILHKLAARLRAMGLDDVRLVGPDTASPNAGAANYAPLTLADSALM